jgi:hypothetical protein
MKVNQGGAEEKDLLFPHTRHARTTHDRTTRRFLEYLLNHPVNRGIGQTLASKDLTAIGERSASWELVICLMRNILCHEYCFGWSSVREMMRVSLAHFGGRHEVEQLLHLYATLVLLPPPSSPAPSPSPSSSGPDDATSSRSSSNAHQGRYRFFFFSFLSPLLLSPLFCC